MYIYSKAKMLLVFVVFTFSLRLSPNLGQTTSVSLYDPYYAVHFVCRIGNLKCDTFIPFKHGCMYQLFEHQNHNIVNFFSSLTPLKFSIQL